jgi:hypothetical protein
MTGKIQGSEESGTMAYVTKAQARAVSRQVWGSRTSTETEIRKSASTPMSANFDIFMSHSYEDAEVIGGIKAIIEQNGLSVYIDWIEDAQINRGQVTPETADTLRKRMTHCKFLLYATSNSSPNSKWMPWELGYFDGLRQGNVGVLPIVESPDDSFKGQEYLGLYPSYEEINFAEYGRQLGRFTGRSAGELLTADVLR